MKTQWIANGDSLKEIIMTNEELGQYIHVDAIQTLGSNDEVYDDLFEALYSTLLKRLDEGSDIESHMASQFYDRYLERLKKDNPELLI